MSQKFGGPGRKPGKPGGQPSGSGDGTPQRPAQPGWRGNKPLPNLRPSDPEQEQEQEPQAQPQPRRSLPEQPQPGQPPQQFPPQQRPGQPPAQQWQGQPPHGQPQQPQWQGQPPPQPQWQGQPPPQPQWQGQQPPQQQWQGQPQGQPEWQENPDPNYVDDDSQQPEKASSLHKIDPGKRLIALMLDYAASYLAAIVVVMIPFVRDFVSLPIIMLLVILSRDFLFGGRGIGKNFMGLRVVDARTGGAPTLVQSFIRNIVLLAPFVVLQIMGSLLKFVPMYSISEVVMSLINILGMVYCAVVLPLESYRAYSRPDSLRKGDEIAGTTIVESPMDFSNPFAR